MTRRACLLLWVGAATAALFACQSPVDDAGVSDPADASTAEEGAFKVWAGDWQAAEPLFLDEATDRVYEAIHELRPEYSVDEIRGLFLSTADVDYTALEVHESTLSFSRSIDGGEEVVCEGSYDLRDDAGGPDAGMGDVPAATTEFELVSTLEGDCAGYERVTLTALLPEGFGVVHFHIVTGTEAGPSRPAPWNPSVWNEATTPELFAELFSQSAEGIASSLPEKTDMP